MRVLLLVLVVALLASSLSAAPMTRKERSKLQQKLDKLVGDVPHEPRVDLNSRTRAPPLPPHRLSRRFAQQNVSELVTLSRWQYQVFTFGTSHQLRIYAVDLNYTILLSTDELMSFTIVPEIPASDQIYEIVVSPVNENIIVFIGKHATWATRDGGQTFTKQATNNGVTYHALQFHPNQTDWIMAESAISNTREWDLWVTTDLGKSWKKIGHDIWQYDWCRAGTGAIPMKRICAVSGDMDNQRFRYTNDLGGSWTTPLDETGFFFYVHDRFFTLIATHQGMIDFYVSDDDGETFRRALLPSGVRVGVMQPQQFIEDDNGVIWILVHPEGGADWGKSTMGDLYVSDADGYKFTKALSRVHTINNWWDVELVRSIEGTLIANDVIVPEPLMMRTLITYDNGFSWNFLKAPAVSDDGKPYHCPSSRECSLHLFGITTWHRAGGHGTFGQAYTHSDAVGLVIGTGNVGSHLDASNASRVHTYFSRDGGLTWDEIMRGSTIYEFGDHGGLLVMAHNHVPTREIYFSYDGGVTFGTVTLEEEVVVSNIITVSAKGERFVVVAHDPESRSQRRFWGVDFTKIHPRNCTDTDYESWEPHDGINGPKCVLGHDIVYRRRKRTATCFTDDDINKVVSMNNCPCSDRDYECDFGFERTIVTNKCVMEADAFNLLNSTALEKCREKNDQVLVSKGYRKLPGDTCEGELEAYKPLMVDCEKMLIYTAESGSSRPLGFGAIVGFIVIAISLVLFGVLIGMYFAMRSEAFRRAFPWVPVPSWALSEDNFVVDQELGNDFKGDLDVALDDDLDE